MIIFFTSFSSLVSFYSPWNHRKIYSILMFSEGIERDQLHKRGEQAVSHSHSSPNPQSKLTTSLLTLLWQKAISYRNQSIDLIYKSMEWFLYDRDIRHERVNDFYPSHCVKCLSTEYFLVRTFLHLDWIQRFTNQK